MKNKEKYRDKIFDIAVSGDRVAVVNGKPVGCSTASCGDCDLNYFDVECKKAATNWMESEEVDWSKVPVDTKILVRDTNNEEWRPRHFAKYENRIIYAYRDGKTSFSAESESDIISWKYGKLAEEDKDE